MDERNSVTAAEIIRTFGFWQSKALADPVVVTHHGRPRVVMLSIEAYERARQSAAAAPAAQGEGQVGAILPALLNHMSEAFVAHEGEDLRIVEINRACETFLGRPRSDLIGKTFVEAFPDAERSVLHDRLRRAVRSGQSFQFETQSRLHKSRRMAIAVFPLPGGAGVLFVNTTDQDRLSENQDNYAALTQALEGHPAVATARLDGRARLTELKGELAEWLGLEPAELQDVRLYDFVVSRDRRRLQDAYELAWENREPQQLQAGFMRRGEGDIELLLTFSPVVRDFTVQAALMVATKVG